MASRSRVAVVYNPTKIDVVTLAPVVLDRAARHGWTEPLFLATSLDDPGTGLAREAVDEGAALVLAVGGDGTVRETAAGLEGTGVPLGIIPRGTGNLLARNLALPLDNLDRALAVAMSGRTRTIDVGHVAYTDPAGDEHEEVFLVMLGAGMDADMIAATDPALKARLGWLAYVRAFSDELVRGHRIEVAFTVDDGADRVVHTRSLLVGNCGILQAGMVLLPEAKLDDGRLDVLALLPKGLVGWGRAAYAILVENRLLHMESAGRRTGRGSLLPRGERSGRRVLDFRQGRRVQASIVGDPAPFQIDGEDVGRAADFEAWIHRKALGVRVALDSR